MPITTEYRCDACGHAQDCPQDTGSDKTRYMHRVSINQQSLSRDHIPPTLHMLVIWCQDCLEKNGLRRPLLRADTPEPKWPTFEDLVRDIVRQSMEDAG
jgi:hypothetical protein